MVPDWLARAVAARYTPAVAVALLAIAAFAQALAQFASSGHPADTTTQATLDSVAFCLLALAATVPLLFLRPAAAAITVSAANLLLLAGFGKATVAGVLAQLIAAYRAGAAAEPRGGVAWEDWLRRVPGARRASVWARAGAQYLGVVLAVPFLVLGAGRPRRRRGRAACVGRARRGGRRDRGAGPARGTDQDRGRRGARGHDARAHRAR